MGPANGGRVKVIYVAGPYRAKTEWGLEENLRHAEDAALRLWQEGWCVLCPHKNTAHFGGVCSDDVWIAGTLELLSRCDAIYMLDDWEKSTGAKGELELAKRLGLDVYYEAHREKLCAEKTS